MHPLITLNGAAHLPPPQQAAALADLQALIAQELGGLEGVQRAYWRQQHPELWLQTSAEDAHDAPFSYALALARASELVRQRHHLPPCARFSWTLPV